MGVGERRSVADLWRRWHPCLKAAGVNVDMFSITHRFSAWPRSKSFMALVMTTLTMGPAGGASAQTGGDCFGPDLPSQLADFGKAPAPALTASAEIRSVQNAQMPMGRSVYLRLAPLSEFHPIVPIRFHARAWKTAPVAGGFASLTVPKAGRYWIAAHENLATIELVPKDATAPIRPSRILSIPCRVGLIVQYQLEAGHYRMQFVSSYESTALIEFTTAGAVNGGFVDLSSRKRPVR